MRSWMAALAFGCCSLLADPAMPEYRGPDYFKLKALLPPGPDAALCFAHGGTEKQYFRYDFTLAAKVKDRSPTLYVSGDCASAEGIGCGVDCGGGGIAIEPVPGRDDAILVRLERIRMALGCGEGEEVELEGGADNKVFKLVKAPRQFCEAMQANADKPLQ